MTWLHRLPRYAWAAPCSAVGLVLAGLLWRSGGRVRAVAGILEVAPCPRRRHGRQPFAAITLGHVVLGTDLDTLARLRGHELVHVRQYERWGPLFFLAYPAASLWQWSRGRRPYWDNPFEVAARRESGGPP